MTSWEQVAAFRLARHHLLTRAPRGNLETVVRVVCGVQAQQAKAAQLALWGRVQDLKPEDVSSVLWNERTLVKTWCMRNALHLLNTEDYPLYLDAASRTTPPTISKPTAAISWMGTASMGVENCSQAWPKGIPHSWSIFRMSPPAAAAIPDTSTTSARPRDLLGPSPCMAQHPSMGRIARVPLGNPR